MTRPPLTEVIRIMLPMVYVHLLLAIIAEVIATSALKATASFTRVAPSLVVITGYGIAFYCLSQCVKSMNIGVVYAIWSGLGIVLVTLAGVFLYKQVPDRAALMGMSLIVAGVLVVNLFSQSTVTE